MGDSHALTGTITKSARGRNYVEQRLLTEHRINAGLGYLAQHADAVGRIVRDKQLNVRIANEPALIEASFNHTLGIFDGQPAYVNVIDERKIQIARAADASSGA